jgi:hypothetical protein
MALTFRLAGWQVMNEVAIHRGRYPHLSVVDAYVDGQHLTEAVVRTVFLLGLSIHWHIHFG